jgi:hypothetical protein
MCAMLTRSPPAGGVSSNVVDLAAWLRMELADGAFEGKQVVAAEPLAEANTAQIRRTPVTDPAVPPGFYGYGMNIDALSSGSMMLSHSGAFTAGGGTNVTLVPASDLGIVVLTNAHAGLAEAIAATFVDVAQSGTVSRDWWSLYSQVFSAPFEADPAFIDGARPDSPAPARRSADLVGRYANDFYGTAVVVQRAGQLALVLGPDHVVLPLDHWSSDRFKATIAIENAPLFVWVDFARDGRKATTVNLGLSDDATSLLTRVATCMTPCGS